MQRSRNAGVNQGPPRRYIPRSFAPLLTSISVSAWLLLFEAYRLTLRLLVLVMSAQLGLTTVAYLRRRRAPATPPLPDDLPHVTVQIPIRNEYYTVERAIEAAVALDYPRERLDIQVLDDSDDRTVNL